MTAPGTITTPGALEQEVIAAPTTDVEAKRQIFPGGSDWKGPPVMLENASLKREVERLRMILWRQAQEQNPDCQTHLCSDVTAGGCKCWDQWNADQV